MIEASVPGLILMSFLLRKLSQIMSSRSRSIRSDMPGNDRSSFLWLGLAGEERLRPSPVFVRNSDRRRS
jgi:hypothetical protein